MLIVIAPILVAFLYEFVLRDDGHFVISLPEQFVPRDSHNGGKALTVPRARDPPVWSF